MKYLTLLFVLVSFTLMAQEKEGDLLQPVTDVSTMQKQEENIPPTIDEVEMRQVEKKTPKTNDKKKSQWKKTK
jgi:hypothetical protein